MPRTNRVSAEIKGLLEIEYGLVPILRAKINTLIDYDVPLNESDKETLNEYVTHLFTNKKPPADDRVFSTGASTLKYS